MTTDMMNLRSFVEKTPDGERICFAAERLMEPEEGGVTGATHARRILRLEYNGYTAPSASWTSMVPDVRRSR